MGNTCSAEGAAFCMPDGKGAPLDNTTNLPNAPIGQNSPRNGSVARLGRSGEVDDRSVPNNALGPHEANPSAQKAASIVGGRGKVTGAAVASAPTAGDPNADPSYSKQFRILLLGAGESGKTTFTQQLSLLHNLNRLSDEERRRDCLQALHENIVQCVSATAANAKRLAFQLSQDDIDRLEAIKRTGGIDKAFADDVRQLWFSESMQRSYQQKSRFWVLDTADWLMDNVARFAEPNFMPTKEDIILSRRRTTGITEHTYVVDDVAFTIIDVGGQRSERRKWVQLFADVHCIVFFVSAIGFCKVLFEDRNTYQMKEALELFSATFRVPAPQTGPRIDNDWEDYVFETTPIHVVFNKMDLLSSLLKRHLLSTCFPAYKAANTTTPVMQFLSQTFMERVVSIRAPPDFHRISAANTDDVAELFRKITQFLVDKERAGHALNMFMAVEKEREAGRGAGGPAVAAADKRGGVVPRGGAAGAVGGGGGEGGEDRDKKRNRQRIKRIQELMRDVS